MGKWYRRQRRNNENSKKSSQLNERRKVYIKIISSIDRSIHDPALPSPGLEPRWLRVQDDLEASSLGNWVVMMLSTEMETGAWLGAGKTMSSALDTRSLRGLWDSRVDT